MNKHNGFTLVELLIVIVVIGILAAISIVSYRGIQQRAQDAIVLSAADQFEKAYQTSMILSDRQLTNGGYQSNYNASTNTCNGGYGGWLDYRNYSYDPNFCTVLTVLENDNTLEPNVFSSLPKTNKVYTNYSNGGKTFMWLECGSGSGTYALTYALNTPNTNEIAELNTTCNGGSNWAPFSTYGMTGGRIIRPAST